MTLDNQWHHYWISTFIKNPDLHITSSCHFTPGANVKQYHSSRIYKGLMDNPLQLLLEDTVEGKSAGSSISSSTSTSSTERQQEI
jgi:hypothetical protein